MPKHANTPAAMLRVEKALENIEAAQQYLGRACAELATLRFGGPQWRAVGKLYDRVHAQWYALREFSEQPQSLSCDSEPEPGRVRP